MYSSVSLDCESGGRLRSNIKDNGPIPWFVVKREIVPLIGCFVFLTSVTIIVLHLPFIKVSLEKSAGTKYSHQHVKETVGNLSSLATQKIGNETGMEEDTSDNRTEYKSVNMTFVDKNQLGNTDLTDQKNTEIFDDLLEINNDMVSKGPSVGFLLPLRGSQDALGFTFGRELKKDLLKKFSKNITEVLVRDTESDPGAARSLTQHFYEFHGTRTFFGYITDEEALSVSTWARSHAPGTRFISPTATSALLETSTNFLGVQPSSKYLVAAVSDFLSLTFSSNKVIIVTQASISKDAFISLLRLHEVKPRKVIYYYRWNDMKTVKEYVAGALSDCVTCPVLLLGDHESWNLIKECDSSIQATWILPFTSQMNIKTVTRRSNIVSFQYRPYDYTTEGFMKPNAMMNPLISTLNASLHLILEGRRYWRGSFLVSVLLSSNSAPEGDFFLPSDDNAWQPVMRYDITDQGVSRNYYEDLVVSKDAIQTMMFARNENCELIIRFIEEATGQVKVVRVEESSVVLLPVARGAQIHLDCPTHHSDVQCRESGTVGASSVSCEGILRGNHKLRHHCAKEVRINMNSSTACSLAYVKGCRGNSESLICHLKNLCTSELKPNGVLSCDGTVINELY